MTASRHDFRPPWRDPLLREFIAERLLLGCGLPWEAPEPGRPVCSSSSREASVLTPPQVSPPV